MKRLAIAFVLWGVVTSAAAADKYAGDWMTYGAGARALGMGGAFAAVAGDANAPYWNPAGMPDVEHAAVSAMHSYTFNGLATYDTVYGVYNAGGYGAVGGGMLRSAVSDIKESVREIPGDPSSRPVFKGYFNWADYAFYVSYGRNVWPWLKLGGNGIVIVGDHDFENAGSSGQAIDLAVMAGPFGPVTVGLNVEDVYSRLSWETGTVETIPLNAKVGAAYRFSVAEWDSEFTLALDCNTKFAGYDYASQLSAGDASFDVCGGGEWWYRRTVALRLGSERSAFAGGVGLATDALGMEFGIDYAFLSDTGLDSSHRASASVAF